MWYIVLALIILGVGVLTFALFFISKIIVAQKTGGIKGQWIFLRYFIIFSIIGYIGFCVFMPSGADSSNLVISIILFCGAVFVLMVCCLTMQTIKDIKHIGTLERENITDPLMDIYNRRYLELRLKEEMTRTQRYKIPFSLLLLDVDHFKLINDQYGYIAGDQVLSKMGHVIIDQVRETDLVARYEGEEIAVLLPNTGGGEAIFAADRLRQIIEQTSFSVATVQNSDLHCTVSIGVTASLEDSTNIIDFLHAAESALCHAKQTGRNRVLLYKKFHNDFKSD